MGLLTSFRANLTFVLFLSLSNQSLRLLYFLYFLNSPAGGKNFQKSTEQLNDVLEAGLGRCVHFVVLKWLESLVLGLFVHIFINGNGLSKLPPQILLISS